MDIRKFKADYLFTGKDLLPADAILITDGTGVIKGISDLKDAGDGIETYQGIITPGFVNTHCHTELSHMKGKIATGTGLVKFLTRVIKERNFKPEDITQAIKIAEAEMYDSGIVAVGDVSNTTDSAGMKINSKIKWYNFIEVIGFNKHDAHARIEYANNILSEFKINNSSADKKGSPVYNTSLVPHAPYSVSQDLFRLINESSADKIITIHNQESNAENELYQHKSGELFELYKNLNIDAASFEATGKTSLQTYLPWLNKSAALLLVHNTSISEDDLLFVEHNEPHGNFYFCICINANRYIQSINPPIDLLRKHHCSITLGTDSYASNHQLNILEEMKTIHREFPDIPLAEILAWATINGANALSMESSLGSFEKGKQPGVILISNVIQQHLSGNSTSSRLL